MSDLPEVRRADCGHGFLPIGELPTAVTRNGMHMQPVYLCADCRVLVSGTRIVTKDVQPVSATEQPAAEPPATVADTENGALEDIRAGARAAALRGESEEACPYADKRTREARAWLAAYREAAR